MAENPSQKTAKKILVVDDEPLILRVVSSRLKVNGYNVITASDGQEAFDKARSENPDLIVLDVMLPKMDGYKVCRLLKQEDKYRHIPIMMFSARVQTEDQEKGLEAGANAYMTKPFDPVKFLAKLEELLKS
ncbi:MAG: response regulator [Candidatus Omnitrophica bacterium]|nr:response regulator [Candidatus Omnitrophota bacterium]